MRDNSSSSRPLIGEKAFFFLSLSLALCLNPSNSHSIFSSSRWSELELQFGVIISLLYCPDRKRRRSGKIGSVMRKPKKGRKRKTGREILLSFFKQSAVHLTMPSLSLSPVSPSSYFLFLLPPQGEHRLFSSSPHVSSHAQVSAHARTHTRAKTRLGKEGS